MRSAPLFVLLLTLGCAQKHPPALLVEGLRSSPSAYRGDGPWVNGLMPRYSAVDVKPVAHEYAFALNVDPSVPTTAPEADASRGDLSKGSRFVDVYGSTIFGDEGKGEMYLLHVGFGEYFRDHQSLSL